MELNNQILIISGPTATGKTSTAIEIAQFIKNAEIVNFDSLLFYKEINIGTAKPTDKERGGITHHLIDISSISNPINAHNYQRMAEKVILEITSRGKTPILVGGSGFYLRALLNGMYQATPTPKEIIEKSDTLYLNEGIPPFLEILEREDKESFQRLHPNDHYRVRRAVEYFWANNRPFSMAKREHEGNGKTNSNLILKNYLHLYLDIPKPQHLEIIESRTNQIIKNGLIDEVKGLLHQGFSGQEKPLQSIGYIEALDYIRGTIKSTDELAGKINISTRQLAKAQRTWFKKVEPKLTLNPLNQKDFVYKTIQNGFTNNEV